LDDLKKERKIKNNQISTPPKDGNPHVNKFFIIFTGKGKKTTTSLQFNDGPFCLDFAFGLFWKIKLAVVFVTLIVESKGMF